jgi:hypothetical protein
MPKHDNAVTGAAGEHYVAYVLNKMGYPVGLTRGGSPGVDLMATNPKTGSTVSIQVKTSRDAWRPRKIVADSHWAWHVGKKAESLEGKDLFYAFVALNDEGEKEQLPDIFIVPSEVVVETIKGPHGWKSQDGWVWSEGWFGFKESECSGWRGDCGLRLIGEKLGDVAQE